ncbi:MAG: glycosyltransferase family 2 protein [Candidatus Sumerlaeaceae bacterium]
MSTLSPESRAPGAISVLIPAYNEQDAIGEVIRQVRTVLEPTGHPAEIIVVDDGSTDSTATNASDAGAHVIPHRTNLGYGAALKTALRHASHDSILILDADGSYPPSAIPILLQELAICDMVVAARTTGKANIPAARRPAKWVLTMTAQFLSHRKIPDLNSGLRAFRRADALRFMSLYPAGFSFTTTITLAYLSNDLLIHYIPIEYQPRVGSSKLRPIRDTKNLFLTVIRSILFFNPLRVCIPAAIFLFVIAGYLALFVRDAQGRILDGTITILVTSALQILIVGFLADILSRLRQ